MRYVVTGAAGFIGSELTRKLLEMGHSVLGIDCFLENLYSNDCKFDNIRKLESEKRFTFHNIDLRDSNNKIDLTEVDTVYHLAAMAGLKSVWNDFKVYQDCNLLATNNLLQIMKSNPEIRLIYTSTSSVYGRVASGGEDLPTNPCSPYGVTKLAAEALIRSYDTNFQLNYKILRLFSVYGPNQRPDMAYSKIIDKIYNGQEIEIFGNGEQVRSNTYIDDVVEALVIMSLEKTKSNIYNVAGSESISLNYAIRVISEKLGKEAFIKYENVRDGDQLTTKGKSDLLSAEMGWKPRTSFDAGIRLQIDNFLTNKIERG